MQSRQFTHRAFATIGKMKRSKYHNTITTPLPPDVEPSAVIDALHNHVLIIELQPLTFRHEEVQSGEYRVWETVDIIPFGLWKSVTEFSVVFQNQPDGLVASLQAPLGITSIATYSVKQDATEVWVLEEAVKTEVACLFWPVVKRNMLAAREALHKRLMKKLGGEPASSVVT